MFLSPPPPSEAVEQLYRGTEQAQGFVMNLARAWAWRPEVFEGFAALRGLLTKDSTLSKREQAVAVCATASALGDAYCSLAWGRTLASEAGAAASAAVLAAAADGANLGPRERALAAWARKVVSDPNGTTAADVDALRGAGFSEREVFEATVFIAFRQAFSTVNDALGIAPDWQLVEAAPPEVVNATAYGRPAAARPDAHRHP